MGVLTMFVVAVILVNVACAEFSNDLMLTLCPEASSCVVSTKRIVLVNVISQSWAKVTLPPPAMAFSRSCWLQPLTTPAASRGAGPNQRQAHRLARIARKFPRFGRTDGLRHMPGGKSGG